MSIDRQPLERSFETFEDKGWQWNSSVTCNPLHGGASDYGMQMRCNLFRILMAGETSRYRGLDKLIPFVCTSPENGIARFQSRDRNPCGEPLSAAHALDNLDQKPPEIVFSPVDRKFGKPGPGRVDLMSCHPVEDGVAITKSLDESCTGERYPAGNIT